MSQYKFPYIKGRPKIMARLRKEDGVPRYLEFLVDSGSDFTMISNTDAGILGLEYNKLQCEEIKVELANMSHIYTKETALTVTIEGNDLIIPVLIAKEEVECLLGRKGVFENFDLVIPSSLA